MANERGGQLTSVLKASSLADSLSEALREQIISGEIPAGTRLTEAWVATRFEVARPTAKSSLDRLSSEGLLRRGPRKSAVVPRLSGEDVFDIYFSREPIESRAVATLAERGEVPTEAERALALMRIAAERELHTDHTEADIAFHRALVDAIASLRLRRMHETVMGEAQLCIAQVRQHANLDLRSLTEDHSAILDAIRISDPVAAVEALKHDLHGCRDKLLADISSRADEKPSPEIQPSLAPALS